MEDRLLFLQTGSYFAYRLRTEREEELEEEAADDTDAAASSWGGKVRLRPSEAGYFFRSYIFPTFSFKNNSRPPGLPHSLAI